MKTPKTIKFSLPLQKPDKDGKYPVVRVNSLEELRDNFDPHGLLYALKTNNLLSRWLEVRGYADEKAQIEEMLSKNLHDNDLVKRMAKIFRLDVPDDELDDLLRDIALMERRREVVQQQAVQESDILSTCQLRYKQYLGLVKKITDNATDLCFINNSLHEMKSRFPELLELGHTFLFDALLDKAPLAVLAMLADTDLRPYYLAYDFQGKPYKDRPYSKNIVGSFPPSVIENKFRPFFFEQLKSKLIDEISSDNDKFIKTMARKLGRSICKVNVTTREWKTLVAKDTKIICLGAYSRYGSTDGKLGSAAANSSTISTLSDSQYFTVLNGLRAKQMGYYDYYVYYVQLE
ncbi:MAG TPA: hypothetical protein H9850_00520 [Candidatus Anaerobiospirillum pullistercoris]|uniref:Uncharacterized protein n=1 Tax=Candidatus Anaerobiospirillum pullistercoris TaxID=2838452 RepID=A0A9D1WB33_9GAMM|nr:hypothetical protein [Candidatus Anaerobiospirillum pullistercoris]